MPFPLELNKHFKEAKIKLSSPVYTDHILELAVIAHQETGLFVALSLP